MTIASRIKSFHVENNTIKNYEEFTAECELKALETDQDINLETTTCTFADRSCIVWCGSDVSVWLKMKRY